MTIEDLYMLKELLAAYLRGSDHKPELDGTCVVEAIQRDIDRMSVDKES